MGVRPPSNNDDNDPETVEFGIAAVDARLRRSDLSFPATEDDVAAALGHEQIPYDVHGGEVALGVILEDVEQSRFESRQQLLNALHPVFETYRQEHSGGVVQQMRSLLPF
ncbi:hypothetical protein EL22_01425 [Halostagnicola sp. A56]|uniref:DUF5789 family protein n=1 Tax=Halostagnicola sp. A56 TaxID=1495067 RepID=UPI00049EF502|nr:hypothetical protein [Halostagnicola sp. A56]KDE58915.1 hypothetical protein EL22_01425 [Halostagnicola sp. A56]